MNLSFKISPRTLKHVDYFESYLKFQKTLKFLLILKYLLQNLRGLGSQKIDFFIAFFNSITIQKVNVKVLGRLDEKIRDKKAERLSQKLTSRRK